MAGEIGKAKGSGDVVIVKEIRVVELKGRPLQDDDGGPKFDLALLLPDPRKTQNTGWLYCAAKHSPDCGVRGVDADTILLSTINVNLNFPFF